MPAVDPPSPLAQRLAARIRSLRKRRHLSLEALAVRSGVSRSMLSLIERGETSPTAVVLERIATALGVVLASLFDADPGDASPLSRAAEREPWCDPQSGYRRCNISPPGYPSPFRLVEVEFPPGQRIAYENGMHEAAAHQQVWVMQGPITVSVGGQVWTLNTGDCLAMRLDQPTAFHNPGVHTARYLVVISSEHAHAS